MTQLGITHCLLVHLVSLKCISLLFTCCHQLTVDKLASQLLREAFLILWALFPGGVAVFTGAQALLS